MSEIISLLPDNIANQIAAGEVIQRPASAVKELMENAIDADATHIHLIIKDAGKELIQVNDNGKGMSPMDARRCFERHATSKIRSIDDLFAIRTMGFRGEALASIAAVAQVELKTKTTEDELGTRILIDHSIVRSQEACQCPVGSSVAVKNLFFNVPARRHFLKSNTVEMRHIIDEFTRISMAHPEIGFQCTNNSGDLFNLEKGKLKQRIIALLGNALSTKLVPVEEPTDLVQITGFIGTPEAATKTRGNQYFFVNNRFIKSAYLNHAVSLAYKDLIAKDEFPFFVLFIDIDPKRIDINVHPTKQEIKFDDERIIYSFVNAAIKHALSRYSIAPSLDFSLDATIEQLPAVTQPFSKDTQEYTKGDFLFQSFTGQGQAHFLNKKEDIRQWKDMYKIQEEFQSPTSASPELSVQNEHDAIPDQQTSLSNDPAPVRLDSMEVSFTPAYQQLNQAFIMVTTRTGFLLIDQHLAHQRVLYERFEHSVQTPIPVQRLLIPKTIELPPADAVLLEGLLDDIRQLGYHIEAFGQHTFIIQGVPADSTEGNEAVMIEQVLEAFKHSASEVKLERRERLIRTFAMQRAIRRGKRLSTAEMETLLQDLFRCEQPQLSPVGAKVFVKLNVADIDKMIAHA